jgi:hypothetical protein
MEADAAAAAAPAAPAAVEKKKRTKKTPLVVNSTNVAGFSTKDINDLFEKECQMAAADKLQEDTNEAKNALESYIYDLRNKLYEGLGPYVQEVRATAISPQSIVWLDVVMPLSLPWPRTAGGRRSQTGPASAEGDAGRGAGRGSAWVSCFPLMPCASLTWRAAAAAAAALVCGSPGWLAVGVGSG